MQRRHFLRGVGGLGAAAALGQLTLLGARAQAAQDDYKALVCVFLFGGNDANNTLVPADAAGYANYAPIRGSLALPQAQLVPLAESSGAARYGLHPDLAPLSPLWQSGQLGLVLNVGTLVQPLTRESYAAATSGKPGGLFSHSDQQAQWQTSIASGPARTGWGGRLSEQLQALNAASTVPAMVSTGGPALFVTGAASSAMTIPVSGSFAIRGFSGSAADNARMAALQQLLQLDRDADLVAATGDIQAQAIANSALVNPLLTAPGSSVAEAFAGVSGASAAQLLAVAKLIEGRAALGLKRQIFMVSLGSFDTHTEELNRQSALFQDLAPALAAFQAAMGALGVADQVTTFTLSDFSRTLQPNTAGGTDHAWGSHHLVLGGAVKGGAYYGTYPTLALGGPDDASDQGRFIPTQAVDQYAATLAQWFGVAPADLAAVLPNLGAFSGADLGFMTT